MLLVYGNRTIRDAKITDAPQLARWWNDGRVMAHAGFPKGTGQTTAQIAACLANAAGGHRLIIEIDHLAAGEMVYFDKGEGTAEIGIKICRRSMQNKGHGKILLSMLLSALLCDLGYERICLDTDAKNKRAQHVYRRLGFRQVGVETGAWTDQTGRLRTAVLYELRRAEFNNFAQ